MTTNVNTRPDVVLSAAQADAIARLLLDHASSLNQHASRTKSAAIAASCRQWADAARQHASFLVMSANCWTTRADTHTTHQQEG